MTYEEKMTAWLKKQGVKSIAHAQGEISIEEKVEEFLDTSFVKCWCGMEGRACDLFDSDFLDESCGGTGILNCHCGGDLCVCHHHGETECFGCPDCEGEDDWEDGDENCYQTESDT